MRPARTRPPFASCGNIAALNVGNALGAWLCGLPFAAGLEYVSPLWASAGVVARGHAVVVAGSIQPRRICRRLAPRAAARLSRVGRQALRPVGQRAGTRRRTQRSTSPDYTSLLPAPAGNI